MAKKKPKRTRRGNAMKAWETQSRSLLEELTEEWKEVSTYMDELDERIHAIRTALGEKVGTGSRRQTGGSGRRSKGVAAAVLKALKGQKQCGVSDLVRATGLDVGQVRAAVMNLKKAGKIKNKARGVYAAA